MSAIPRYEIVDPVQRADGNVQGVFGILLRHGAILDHPTGEGLRLVAHRQGGNTLNRSESPLNGGRVAILRFRDDEGRDLEIESCPARVPPLGRQGLPTGNNHVPGGTRSQVADYRCLNVDGWFHGMSLPPAGMYGKSFLEWRW